MNRCRLLLVAALLPALALPKPALASVSVAAGGYVQNTPSTGGAAAIVSSGGSIPVVPLEFQTSVLVPLTKTGGYAATLEIRGFTGGGLGGAYVGFGAGLGNISTNRTNGTVFTVFGGKSVAPFTSLEVRLYKQTQETGATAGFVGLRFSL